MVGRSFDPSEQGSRRVREIAFPRNYPAPEEATRYRLDVVGTSVPEVVEHAGGWIFDRVGAGWAVTVLVSHMSDPRPLRILGAEVIDLHAVLGKRGQGRQPQAIAVGADICQDEPRARRGLMSALADGRVEVVVWGGSWTSPPEHRVDPVRHHLSVAARAFKARAMQAAGLEPTPVGETEVFHSGSPEPTPAGVDLVPIG